jgi:hypothetical protein
MSGVYRTTLSKVFSQEYEVLSGTQVDKKWNAIFTEESKKTNCRESACYKAMVVVLKSALIATTIVKKVGAGYLLSWQINNPFENKQVYSRSLLCSQ